MSLQTIIRNRQNALFVAWKNDPFQQVQVETIEELQRHAFLDDLDLEVETGQSGRRSLRNAVIVRRDGNPDTNASVWVRAGYSGYRNAWLGFVRQVYQVSATPADLAGYNIDHLLNRARSPGGAGLIRIEAINDQVNQAWGRLFEKAASNPDFYANQARYGRKLSWLIAAKLMGQMPPRGPDDQAGIDRLVRFFQAKGLAEDDPRGGLINMLNFAYGLRW